MKPPDCPLYHGSWVCNVCIRAGRDFRYTFCRLAFPRAMAEGCSLARTVKGVSPPTAPGFGIVWYSQPQSETGGARGGEAPSTGKGTEPASIDPPCIASDLTRIIERAIKSGPSLSGIAFHTRVQRNVSSAAVRHGCSGAREYPIAYNAVDRHGRSLEVYGLIDVVWYRASEIVAAIEIDSCFRKNSIAKLMASDAKYKFWICYGNPKVCDLADIDYDIINVIHRTR